MPVATQRADVSIAGTTTHTKVSHRCVDRVSLAVIAADGGVRERRRIGCAAEVRKRSITVTRGGAVQLTINVDFPRGPNMPRRETNDSWIAAYASRRTQGFFTACGGNSEKSVIYNEGCRNPNDKNSGREPGDSLIAPRRLELDVRRESRQGLSPKYR